jgi:dTDP-4-amino-4,6-dideoxygalactose transaminase
MYLSVFPSLAPTDLLRRARPSSRASFPFNVSRRMSFYRARNAIYYLFRALRSSHSRLTVLAPDYHSGNEVLALRAAGATIRYYTVGRDMRIDLDQAEQLCRLHKPDVFYVIHYLGWPQPIQEIADLCRRRGMLLVEDCALTLLSAPGGRPLGSFGHFSVFCLYKTLPVPNGALLVQNAARLEELEGLKLRRVGLTSVMGRTAELLLARIRSRTGGLGAALQTVKRSMGRAAGALDRGRASVGDIGFNLSDVDLAMSGVSAALLQRLDFDDIRRRRVENFRQLAARLDGSVTTVHADVTAGLCPLFFPILVADKPRAAMALRQRGIDVLEFWNAGAVDAREGEASAATRFLHAHVLGLPVHQDLTPRQIDHLAQQVSSLNLRMAS